jgi:hypothetical protein
VATTVQAYVRLHGSPRIYYSAYGTSYLRSVAAWLSNRDGWCIFDNTLPAQRCTTLNCKKYNAALKNACNFDSSVIVHYNTTSSTHVRGTYVCGMTMRRFIGNSRRRLSA